MIDNELYLSEIKSISEQNICADEKLLYLKNLLERLCIEITQYEVVQFPNLFSRLVFISQKFQLPKQLEWKLQHIRATANDIRKKSKSINKNEYVIAERAVFDLLAIMSGNKPTPEVHEITTDYRLDNEKYIRAYIKKIDRDNNFLYCVSEKQSSSDIIVKFGINPENKAFDSSVEMFWEGAQINIIDFSIDKNGYLIPKLIVLEPDYLIDASALAECFQSFCVTPMHYFRNKFESVSNSSHILLGNLANFFLDELVFTQNPMYVKFEETFLRSFKNSPFEYASCQDIAETEDFMAFMQKAKLQFNNICRVITSDFPHYQISAKRCTLEPSFFSEKYGFQGRLDLLQADDNQFKIIELKSGRLPFPSSDIGIISLNHEVQTYIYRLLIESVFGASFRQIEAAILYSSGNGDGENLRFVATYQALEKEIINLRNIVVANEYKLINGDLSTVEQMFEKLFDTAALANANAKFYPEKLEKIKSVLKQCYPLELSYFYRFTIFISRELYLQKIGDVDYESPTGTASLWNSDFQERAEALDVLYDLSIDSLDDSGSDMVVIFKRSSEENEIVNFREGEICIVYPRNNPDDDILCTQILKGSIIGITKDFVGVRFRYKQRNREFFDSNSLWAIEHDRLDSSINSMYKSLFSFLQAPKEKRDLILGNTEPQSQKIYVVNTNYPENIIQKALVAEDYFLVVGPPGSGKTSIFARRLIEELYSDSSKNILVLAYTNRAVDELCAAIHDAFGCKDKPCDKYIRVGTGLSCAEPFRERLLQNISEQAKDRSSIKKTIEDTRIFVSTIASINGRTELFDLKKFDVAIVDEASQILEPQIIGLLPRFNKTILIGDHNQLAAIVLQKEIHSKIEEDILLEAGFVDCRESLFERLIRTCINNGWDNAYAILNKQGRMHQEIGAFAGKYFYNNNLFPAMDWQKERLAFQETNNGSLFHQSVANSRVAFFSTENLISESISNKVNEAEAEAIVSLIKALVDTYKYNQEPLNMKDIGVIAPYRNQIALIRHKLSESGISNHEEILIDTIERFQGSQRDIILISFCVNKSYQLRFLSNLDSEGKVDRKLNVTLTRARKQMFMVGNARLLRQNRIYSKLLNFWEDRVVVL